MSSTLLNGNRPTGDERPRVSDSPVKSTEPLLVDGRIVEIPQHLIQKALEAGNTTLPDLPPDEDIIRPVANELSDLATQEQVTSTLSSLPVIALALRDADMLQSACDARREEVTRLQRRLLDRQDSLPKEVPASTSPNHKHKWWKDALAFWLNWSGLLFAALAAWLGATILTEVLYQIGGLRESSWGLVQSFFGAFGFCWGFTMAVVIATFWRRRSLSNPNEHPLDRRMSWVAFMVSWWGLAGFGLMLGLTHSFEGGDEWFLPPLRCALTTASVISLGMACVALEKGTEHRFRTAYKWTLVLNEEIEAMDEVLHPLSTQLMTLAQIEKLASGVEERIQQHIRSQQQRWLSRRDAIRLENQRGRDVAAEEQKVLLAQQRLATLRIADVA